MSLTERFAALQEMLMTLYETDPADLQSQIRHWDLVKKEYEYLYYARKEGLGSLGLYPAPALQVSETKAKQAIKMGLLLKSLATSQYASESWRLRDTSVELVLQTEPKHCFKKGPFEVEVWFDNDPQKALPYSNWEWIYYQDQSDEWHKVKGKVDYNGLYFEEHNGDRTYFTIFDSDAAKYGQSGQWTVRYKNEIISASVTSSSRVSYDSFGTRPSTSKSTSHSQSGRQNQSESPRKPVSSTSDIPRRRRGEGEHSPRQSKRRRTDSGGGAPSPEEVGRSHRSVEGRHLGRLGLLQAEARDPPLVLVKGHANNLKCWRRRVSLKYRDLYWESSTIWNWVGDDSAKANKSRMLYVFSSIEQRDLFVKTVHVPKGSAIAFGNLDSI